MAFDVNRWVKYARARIDAAVGQGNRELDRREAEREADLADRPWLAADGTAPNLDEARARIRWEAQRQERADGRDALDGPAGPGLVDGEERTGRDAAEAAGARLELEDRSRRAADRLDRIRRELGVDGPDAQSDGP